jgi:hypothetical protein
VGILIAGLVVITMLLVASGLMFSNFLDTSVTGSQSLKDITRVSTQRSGSALNITSGVFDGEAGKDLSVQVDNTGSQTVVRFGEMDVIVEYTDSSDNNVLTHLDYQVSGIGDNEWTVPTTGVTPDSFNPGLWDSDENLFIDMRVDPAVKSGTDALVVVATPWGISDQTSVSAP